MLGIFLFTLFSCSPHCQFLYFSLLLLWMLLLSLYLLWGWPQKRVTITASMEIKCYHDFFILVFKSLGKYSPNWYLLCFIWCCGFLVGSRAGYLWLSLNWASIQCFISRLNNEPKWSIHMHFEIWMNMPLGIHSTPLGLGQFEQTLLTVCPAFFHMWQIGNMSFMSWLG